ncbi:MAG: NADPH-dependent FMN reductase [Lewinella sp.]|uniref:NADPH-dependent FMN reductase n=1 Tax=Lewinella sp. TaxID=2004506 RepID=UPI003D6A47F4
MITVISGTNRKGSRCRAFAHKYYEFLSELIGKEEVSFLALEDIPQTWLSSAMYEEGGQHPDLTKIQDEYILPADGFVFISPEYNGSFPGVLKLFIDACSVRNYARNFKGKKAALVGVSTGRAGNLRGMSHLAGVLHYLGATTMPNQLPISSIAQLMNTAGEVTHEDTLIVMKKHAQEFAQFVGVLEGVKVR